mgnify:CR=1 FL=1
MRASLNSSNTSTERFETLKNGSSLVDNYNGVMTCATEMVTTSWRGCYRSVEKTHPSVIQRKVSIGEFVSNAFLTSSYELFETPSFQSKTISSATQHKMARRDCSPFSVNILTMSFVTTVRRMMTTHRGSSGE